MMTRLGPTARSSRDHGRQSLDAVLRNAPSTPRPVTLFPG
jgi:hypothetical protein